MFKLDELAEFLEVPVDEVNETRVRVLTSKAVALIRQYATALPEDVSLWPQEVRDLGLTVVARAIEQAALAGTESESYTAGPFAKSRSFSSDVGTVWLTKQEKDMLRGSGGSAAYAVDLMPADTAVGRRWLSPTEWEPINGTVH